LRLAKGIVFSSSSYSSHDKYRFLIIALSRDYDSKVSPEESLLH
jgi:hypothetical protein